MSEGERSFSHALCRKACLQIIYAQAERRALAQPAVKPDAKPSRQNRPPIPASSVYIVDKVTDALADVVSSLIAQVALSASARARHAGRTNVVFYDVVATLDSMSVTTQSSVRDVAQYCAAQRVDFPHAVPQYPVLPPASQAYPPIAAAPANDERERPYIEHWMPDIPPPHTFVANPGLLAVPGKTITVSGTEQRRRAEASLAKLREVAATADTTASSNGAMEQNSQAMQQHVNDGANGATINPFMALPILMAPDSKAAPSDAMDIDAVDSARALDAKEPLEVENVVEANTDVEESGSYVISDLKRARVDRILAESGTIMLSQAAATNTTGGGANGAATATNSNTPSAANNAKSGADGSNNPSSQPKS